MININVVRFDARTRTLIGKHSVTSGEKKVKPSFSAFHKKMQTLILESPAFPCPVTFPNC